MVHCGYEFLVSNASLLFPTGKMAPVLETLLPWLRRAPGRISLEHQPYRTHSTSDLSLYTARLPAPVSLVYNFFIIIFYF